MDERRERRSGSETATAARGRPTKPVQSLETAPASKAEQAPAVTVGHGPGETYSVEQWLWVADRVKEGYTMTDLARFLGVHRNTVRAALIRLGVRPPKRTHLRPLAYRYKEFRAAGQARRAW